MRFVFILLSITITFLLLNGCSPIEPIGSGTIRKIEFSKYTLSDNGYENTVGNNDGIANKNETLRMNVEIRNSSVSYDGKDADIRGIRVTLATNDPYITINPNYKSAEFGDLPSSTFKDITDYSASTVSSIGSAYDSDCFLFAIGGACPANHQIPFYLNFTDDNGEIWRDTFYVPVQGIAANLEFSKYSLYDGGYENTVGNNDNLPNKSETLRMNVELRNTGTSGVNGVSATLTTTDQYVTISQTFKTGIFGNIPSSTYKDITDYSANTVSSIGSAYDADCFLFSISSACPANHNVLFQLSIVDDKGNTWTDTFSVVVVGIGANIEFSTYSLYDGGYESTVGNSDNLPNKNETLRLNIELKNTGTSGVNGITATLSTSDQFITISQTYKTGTYGDIPAGTFKDITDYSSNMVSSIGSAYDADCFLFSVSATCPANHVVPFVLSIADNKGNNWTDTFNITVVGTGASIMFSRYSLYDGGYESTIGNNNSIPNKGETLRLNVELRNSGTSNATGVSATLSTTSPYITVSPSYKTAAFGNIAAGTYKDITDYSASTVSSIGSAYDADCFLISVSSTCPANHQASFSLTIADDKSNSWSSSFTITVQ